MEEQDPNLSAPMDPKEKEKMTTKDFIRLRKKQMKIQKDNQIETVGLESVIKENDVAKFS